MVEMAVSMSRGDGTPFYDPFYNPSQGGQQGNRSGWADDFSVFNHLHLPRSGSVPFTPPRSSSSTRDRAPTRLNDHEVVCRVQKTEDNDESKKKEEDEPLLEQKEAEPSSLKKKEEENTQAQE